MLKVKEIKAIKAEIMKADQKRRAELFDALIENAIQEQKKSGKSFSIDQVKKLYGLHVTQKHTGKMEGMLSLSTNMLINAFCKAHRNTKGAICEHCYASTLLSFRESMQAPYTFNSYLLKHTILPMDILPVINARVFRYESFGDLDNVTQAINYLNIARKNPQTTFALWTKNPVILSRAFKAGYTKPENLIIIYSSLFLNDRTDGEKMLKVYPWIDKVFTVYDDETIKEKGIVINCGARHCLSCGRCYSKETERFINERKK